MAESVQVTFRDIPRSEAVVFRVEKRAAKLRSYFKDITHCHVVLEMPHRSQTHGQRFHVRIDFHVPGRELIASRNAQDDKEDLHATVDGAFDDAERMLAEYVRRQDDEVHSRPGHPKGVVTKLFEDRGYGFLQAEDGHEVYFHENSVHGRFAKLAVGTRVRYAEEEGDKGPQARTVEILAS